MNYFPNGDEEISLIKFIAKFQYLNVADVKYFFSTKRYYKYRVKSLIAKKFLKKVKLYLILDELGIEYAKLFNFEYTKRNRNQNYISRLSQISNLAAFYNKSDLVTFTPSFCIKDKEMFTITARKFIGILEINGFEYLTYKITNEHDDRYLKSVIYDIQKERKYKNIIVLVDNLSMININDFAFGMNRVLVIEDNTQNREKLKYLHSINWSEIINKYYRNKAVLSEYNFCDYTDYKHTYISYLYFFDTEKITRIKQFLRENKNKSADIICNSELAKEIKKLIPKANYIIVDLEEYIDKERNYYD